MRHMRHIAVLILLFGVVALLAGAAVLAQDEHGICSEVSSGAQYGAHIAEHAHAGHFSGTENPGVHHKGYSPCVP